MKKKSSKDKAAPTLPAPVRASAIWSLSQLDALLRKEVTATIDRAHIPGMNLRGYWALEAIAASSRLTQSELSELLGIDRSDMVRLMDTLQDAGLAQRTRDDSDRRRQLITLTAKGDKIKTSLRRAIRRAEQNAATQCPAGISSQVVDWLSAQSAVPDTVSPEDAKASDPVPPEEQQPVKESAPQPLKQEPGQTNNQSTVRKTKKKKKRSKKKRARGSK